MISIAFLLGLTGSIHCIGMCSPLIMHFTPFQTGTFAHKAWLYHAGRISAYLLIGIVGGTLGLGLNLIGIQSYVSFLMGFLILVALLVEFLWGKSFFNKLQIFREFSAWIHHIQTYIYQNQNLRKMYFFGFANGILPCGLVYLAFTGAVAQSSLVGSLGYMLLFGLGTLPALITFSWLGGQTKFMSPKIVRWFSSGITLIAAFLLMYRGVNTVNKNTNTEHHSAVICVSQ